MPTEMTKRTIVLKEKREKEEILKLLSESGGKVIHDSGERVLVIEVPKNNESKLKASLPNTSSLLRLTDHDNIKRNIIQPSPHELLFIDALKLRTSESFINEKRLRKPGSTPEEQKMLLESDFLGDDMSMNDI